MDFGIFPHYRSLYVLFISYPGFLAVHDHYAGDLLFIL